jgi:hypothetical protein
VIGKSPLPSPASITLGQMLTGAEDGRWVEVEGVVHAIRESGKNIDLDLALSDGTVLATTIKEVGADYDSLVDAKVRLRGNQAPLFNHQGAMTGSYLVFPDRAQVMVMEPPPAHPFTLPISPVSSLLRFNPKPAWDHRVHIRGAVTLARPGRLLCLQDGPQGLCAQTDQTTPLNPGELADVIGFPIIGAFTPTLTSATYEAAGYQRSGIASGCRRDQDSLLVDSNSCNQHAWFSGCAHPGSPCLVVRAAQPRQRTNPNHPAAASGSGQTRVRDSNTQ